jgi:hypothetical protein
VEAAVAALGSQIIKLDPACLVCQGCQHDHSGSIRISIWLLMAVLLYALLTVLWSSTQAVGLMLAIKVRISSTVLMSVAVSVTTAI